MGDQEHIKIPDGYDNYPLLLESLCEKLDEQGEKDGVYYSHSFAGGANIGFVASAQLGLTGKYLDDIQIIIYDIHGTWEE